MIQQLNEQNISSIDMVTSTFLTIAQVRGKKAGAVLAVSDECLYGKFGFRDPAIFRSRAENHRSRAPSAAISLTLAVGPSEIMSAAQSPLFEPVLWHDDGFKILDEIQVPQKIEYIDVTEVGQALDAVREMKTRAFGQVLTFLYSAALVAQHYHSAEAAPCKSNCSR